MSVWTMAVMAEASLGGKIARERGTRGESSHAPRRASETEKHHSDFSASPYSAMTLS
jgi:hypothetical protein